MAIATDCMHWGPKFSGLKEGSIYRRLWGIEPPSLLYDSRWEDMDSNIPQWIGRTIRIPEFYLGYRSPAANQGIEPRDFGLQTGIAPPYSTSEDSVMEWVSWCWIGFFC